MAHEKTAEITPLLSTAIDAFVQLSEDSISLRSVTEFTHAALPILLHALDAEGGCILLVDSDPPKLKVVASKNFLEPIRPELIEKGQDYINQSVQFRETRFTGDRKGIALPLKANEILLGAMAIRFSFPLSQTEVYLVENIVKVLSAALFHVREQEGARERKNFHEKINFATARITEAMETVPTSYLMASIQRGFESWPRRPGTTVPGFLIPVLKVILHEAKNLVNAQVAALGIGNTPAVPFDPWIVEGTPEGMISAIGRFPRPVGVLGLVAVEGQTLRIKDVKKHPSYIQMPPGHPEVTQFLGLPIEYGKSFLGNLYFGNKIGADEFTEDDISIVRQLSNFAGTALQQAYLHAALEVQQSQIQAILDSAPIGIIFVEKISDRVVANAAASELFGRPLRAADGRQQYASALKNPDGTLISVDELPSSKALRGELVKDKEMIIQRQDGKSVPISASSGPVFDYQKKIYGAVTMFLDIRSSKDLEQLREEFTAMVVHDLRNPMQSLLNQIQLLRLKAKDTEPSQNILVSMEQNINHLSNLLKDLLDVAKIELKQLNFSFAEHDLTKLTSEILERTKLGATGRIFDVHIPDSPLLAKVDKTRFHQILSNILDNALKYSLPPSPITVTLTTDSDFITLVVQDRGVGIPRNEIQHIFDRFYRGRKFPKTMGLGLGLHIVKALVEAHGGKIWVESTPGIGTAFHVSFPRLRESLSA